MSETGGDVDQSSLREALKRVAVALKDVEIPFALMGGYAVWARGGPESLHDVDFLIAEEDAADARQALADEGLELVDAPEDWLFKVATDGAVVDLIFRVTGQPASREVLEDVDELEVLSVMMPVLSSTEILVQKLYTLSEHYCDFGAVIPIARALREQVDWGRVRAEVGDNAFAAALLFLLERLEVVPPAGSAS